MLQDEQERLEKDRRADGAWSNRTTDRLKKQEKHALRSLLLERQERKRSVKYFKIAIHGKYFDSFHGEKVKPCSVYKRCGSGTDNYKSTKEALIRVQYNPFCS